MLHQVVHIVNTVIKGLTKNCFFNKWNATLPYIIYDKEVILPKWKCDLDVFFPVIIFVFFVTDINCVQ
jgi:hypothetical protein